MEYVRHVPLVAVASILLYSQTFGFAYFPNFTAIFYHWFCRFVTTVIHVMWFVWTDPNLFFLSILVLRYYRLIVHIYAYLRMYKHDEIPENPTVTAKNAHVVVPTVDPGNASFERCLRTILRYQPTYLTIVTGGREHAPRALQVVQNLQWTGSTRIKIVSTAKPNKRDQMTLVLRRLSEDPIGNKDTIVIFVDDHAWWQGSDFLAHVLAPFEDHTIGLVGTKKRVARDRGTSLMSSFVNFIGCTYLERHNFEIISQNAIDGGAFVISARTCAVRASIVMDKGFQDGFTNERFYFGKYGPLNSDDDNYITRYVVNRGWRIKFQAHSDGVTLMHTTIGVDGIMKLRGQLLRWARSQWRSNACSLFTDRSVYRYQWWTWHAAFLTSFVNLALIWDPLILWAGYNTSYNISMWGLYAFILATKMVKLAEFFSRNPRDIVFFPLYVLFGYFHSFIKIWSLYTFWDTNWGGRKLRTDEQVDEIGSSLDSRRSSKSETDWLPSTNPPPDEEFVVVSQLPGLRRRISRLADQYPETETPIRPINIGSSGRVRKRPSSGVSNDDQCDTASGEVSAALALRSPPLQHFPMDQLHSNSYHSYNPQLKCVTLLGASKSKRTNFSPLMPADPETKCITNMRAHNARRKNLSPLVPSCPCDNGVRVFKKGTSKLRQAPSRHERIQRPGKGK